MILLDAELQDLEALYDELGARLDRQFGALQEFRPPETTGRVSETELSEAAEEAGRRITRIVQSWRNGQLPMQHQSELAGRIATLRDRAQRLLRQIDRNVAGFQQLQSSALESLQGLRTGEQFLASVRSRRENRPKFIDARR